MGFMRKLVSVFLLILLVSTVLARSPAGPEDSIQVEVSKGQEAINFTLLNNREIKASNISLDVAYEELSGGRSFELDELDGGDNYTFTVPDEDLDGLMLENISGVNWNVSGRWQENFKAVFDLIPEDEEQNAQYGDDAIDKPTSPVTFSFRRNRLLIFEEDFSRKIILRYRPLSGEMISNLNVSIKTPEGVNISKKGEMREELTGIKYYSLYFSSYSLEREELSLDLSAEYNTLNYGDEFGLNNEEEASGLDPLRGFLSLIFWAFSFSLRILISAIGLIF